MAETEDLHRRVKLARMASLSLNDIDDTVAEFAAALSCSAAREISRIWLAEQVRSAYRDEALTTERAAQERQERTIAEYNARPDVIARRQRADEEFEAKCAARQSAMQDRINRAVADFANELRMEWTAELLASEFRLPSGEVTTWGAATIEDHEARRAMFAANAAANAEGAARHMAAIEALRAAGAACLNELPTDQAASDAA